MDPDGLSKHWKALAIASASAPYLVSLFQSLHLLTRHGLDGIQDAIEFVAAILVLGTAGLVIYGIPIAIAAGGFGGILIWIGFRHPVVAIIFGASLGAVFNLLVLHAGPERMGNAFWPYLISMILSGSICGWIYWRIAIRGMTGFTSHEFTDP